MLQQAASCWSAENEVKRVGRKRVKALNIWNKMTILDHGKKTFEQRVYVPSTIAVLFGVMSFGRMLELALPMLRVCHESM